MGKEEDMENLAEGIRVSDERLRALESVCFRLLDAHKRSVVDWEAFKELERLLRPVQDDSRSED